MVIGILQLAGFSITQTFANHLVIDAAAPTTTVEQFFTTTIHDVSQETSGIRYAPATSFTIPASLAPYVAGVPLDNLITAKPGSHRIGTR